MSPESLLAECRPGGGPRWRVAVVRDAGQAARVTAADVAEQLRRAGGMATSVDVIPGDPFIDHRIEWAGRAHPNVYDVIAVVGDLSPAVVALAVLADAPVVCLPVGALPVVAPVIEQALAGRRLEILPLAQGARRRRGALHRCTRHRRPGD